MKNKLLLTSILSIVMCFSLICGATFALFTSESKVNIAVTSGTVSIVATASKTEQGSTTGTANNSFKVVEDGQGGFALTGMVPHDYVNFEIVATNYSDVDIQYRVATELNGGLASALAVTITEKVTNSEDKLLSNTGYTDWRKVDGGHQELGTYIVTITFESQDDPNTGVNEDDPYQGKKANLAFKFEAVQGNAPVVNPIEKVENTTNEYNINDELGMQLLGKFAQTVGAGEGKLVTFNIMKDMNMEGYNWDLNTMWLVINGNGYTISNLTQEGWRAGLFGYGGAVKINNLVLENFNLTGAQVGIIAGAAEGASASNITIKGTNTLTYKKYETSTYSETWNGIGAIFGVTQNSNVENVTIASDAVININYGTMETDAGCKYCDDNAGGTFIQNYSGTVTVETGAQINKTGNIYYPIADGFAKDADGNYVVLSEEGLVYFAKTINEDKKTYKGETILIENDLDMTGIEWTPINGVWNSLDPSYDHFYGTFDGQNKVISNITISGEKNVGLFAKLYNHADHGGIVKNITIKNATVSGGAYVGGIVGQLITGTVSGCKVIESTVIAVPYASGTSFDGGDKVGAVVGFSVSDGNGKVENCVTETVTVKAYRDVGGVVGAANGNALIGNVARNVKVTADQTVNFYGAKDANAGAVLGRNIDESTFDASNVAEGENSIETKLNTITNSALSNTINSSTTAPVVLNLGATEVKLPSAQGKAVDVTIKGTKDTVIDVTNGAYMDQGKIAFEGVTIKGSTGKANGNGSDWAALYSPNATYTNCYFDGGFRVGRDGAKFIGCTFNLTSTSATGVEYVWTEGNDVTFEDCIFNTDGKALLVYSDGNSNGVVKNVVVKDCTFNADSNKKPWNHKNGMNAAIEIDSSNGTKFNITISGNNPYNNTNFSGLWRIKVYTNTAVTINDVPYNATDKVYIDGIAVAHTVEVIGGIRYYTFN